MKTFLSADRRFLNPQAMENVELKAAVPAKDTENNPLFTQDMPWEIRIDNGYPNVIYDRREQIFHCYYTLFTEDKDTEGTTLQERTQRNYRPRMDRVTSLAYARSKDGIHWEKPSLGLVDWRGSKENNLLFRTAINRNASFFSCSVVRGIPIGTCRQFPVPRECIAGGTIMASACRIHITVLCRGEEITSSWKGNLL